MTDDEIFEIEREIECISGGRKKNGRVLSNLYKLTLPKSAPKREKFVLL